MLDIAAAAPSSSSATAAGLWRLGSLLLEDQQVRLVPPTFTRGKDSAKQAEAWHASMDVFLDWLEYTDEVWKDYLIDSPPLPDLPHQVLETYGFVSPPPLVELCPVDFEMRCWGSFKEEMDGWLAQQPRDETLRSPDRTPAGNFRIVLSGMLRMSGMTKGLGLSSVCCTPDAMDRDLNFSDQSKFPMCSIGNMAWDLDEHTNLEIEVARLYSYMLLTDCYFGLVSCYTKTYAVKRLPGLDGCVFVSPPVHYRSGDALKACAFVVWQGQNFDAAKAQASYIEYVSETMLPLPGQLRYPRFFSSTGPREFDRAPILARLWKLGKEVGVANMRDLVGKLVWWNDVSALDKLELLTKNDTRVSATATYSYAGGRGARLKFRDLADSKTTDTDSSLRKFLREVDVYKRLRKLQGDVIPELLEYGFVRGATVCFVVMSDHGPHAEPARALSRPETRSMFKSSLHKVHAHGIHFGGDPRKCFSRPGMLLRMSHALVDGDKAGMAKDIKFLEEEEED